MFTDRRHQYRLTVISLLRFSSAFLLSLRINTDISGPASSFLIAFYHRVIELHARENEKLTEAAAARASNLNVSLDYCNLGIAAVQSTDVNKFK